MPRDRIGFFLEGIEQNLLGSSLALNINNRTRAAQQFGISGSGLNKEFETDRMMIGA